MAERDELGRTLALARATLRGPAAMKQRVRAQLATGALATRAPAASAASTGLLAAARRLLVRRYHLATVALLVGVGFGAGFWLGRVPIERQPADGVAATAPATPPASSSNPLPPRAADDGSAAPIDALANPASRTLTATSSTATSSTRPARPRRPEPRATRAASDDALMREVALLERIDRAIRAGEGRLAAALLDELDRSVPAPALRDERTAARMLTRCVVARESGSSARQEAHASAERFLARDPRSVYADRIRAACPLEGPDTNGRARIEEPTGVGH